MKPVLALALLALASSSAAKADTFIPSGPGTVTVSTAGQTVDLHYDDTAGYKANNPVTPDVFTYTATAASTGLKNLTYVFTGNSGYFMGQEGFSFTDSRGTTNVVPYTSASNGPFTYRGSLVLNLVAGQSYSFTIQAANYDSQHIINGDLMLTPAAVTPEPSSLMLLGTGALSAAGLLRRRMQQS